jgi:hypothetical protein
MGFGMINSYGKTGYYAKQAFETATNAKETADEALELAEEAIERVEARVIKVLPAQDGTLTYDGTEQTVTWKNVTPGSLTFGGVQSATNAGSYTATCKPTKSYKWEDGTVGEKNIVWTIDRQAIYDVPSQTGAIVYDGTEKSPTWENYDTDKMTIGGTTTGTDVGSYNATFTPKANYKWQDGSVDAKTVAWSIIQELLIVPAQSGTLTFDGTEKTPVLDSNYDPSLMTLSGDTAATNAGTYTLTVSLTDTTNYRWEDGTATPKTVSWTIGRSVIGAVPSQDGTLTYTGNAQTVQWSNYNSAQLTLDGTTVGTDAGTYTAVFTPKSNYTWDDGIDAKNVTWEIGKAAGAVTLSKDSITLNTSTLTDTFTYTRLGDGAVTVTSSDSTKATVSDSSGTVTVTAVASGNATVTVSVAEGTNYLAASGTVSVAVQLMPALNDATWAQISEAAIAGTAANYWDIGDCKEIMLNGRIGNDLIFSNKKLWVYILGFNHEDNGVADNNIIFCGFKNALTNGVDVALCDASYGKTKEDGTKTFNLNHWGSYNYGGWKASDLRYDILGATSTAPKGYGTVRKTTHVGYDATESTLTNPVANTFLAALPSELRSVIRLRTHYVDNTGNKSNVDANVTAVVDAVSLLAEFEIFGTRTYANQYEKNHQAQMTYYANGNSKKKYKHSAANTGAYWLECSPHYNNNGYICCVNDGAAVSYTGCAASYSLAPAFKL